MLLAVNVNAAQSNLIFAWIWILAGFLSGMIIGLKFQDPNWLGGYSSFKRRMHRLAHISFFGLGAVNLLFYFSLKDTTLTQTGLLASRAFILGGIAMPICCWLMAWRPKTQPLFAIPVISLVSAAVLTLVQLMS
jgi:hypothetical protein